MKHISPKIELYLMILSEISASGMDCKEKRKTVRNKDGIIVLEEDEE